jgi:hypothetical protein
MAYIALVPEFPLFLQEHCTLAFLGREPKPQEEEMARRIVDLYNLAARRNGVQKTEVIGHGILGAKRVQLLDGFALAWRELTEQCGLDKSGYPSWVPHISARERHHLRPVGEVVRFPFAEYRP